jgi:hypothetical protein
MILPAFLVPMAEASSRTRARRAQPALTGSAWDPPDRFPGEIALRDLDACRDDAESTGRVVARYLALRSALLTRNGAPSLGGGDEHAWAAEYVVELDDDEERSALHAILEHASQPASTLLWAALETAASSAARSGHDAGAYALRRHAYTIGVEAGAWVEAARSARTLEAAARQSGERRKARLWAARARRLVRRRIAPELIEETMAEAYTRQQRQTLRAAVRAGAAVNCPACGEKLAERNAPPRNDIAYVRRRIVLICTGCRRSASFDITVDGQP